MLEGLGEKNVRKYKWTTVSSTGIRAFSWFFIPGKIFWSHGIREKCHHNAWCTYDVFLLFFSGKTVFGPYNRRYAPLLKSINFNEKRTSPLRISLFMNEKTLPWKGKKRWKRIYGIDYAEPQTKLYWDRRFFSFLRLQKRHIPYCTKKHTSKIYLTRQFCA